MAPPIEVRQQEKERSMCADSGAARGRDSESIRANVRRGSPSNDSVDQLRAIEHLCTARIDTLVLTGRLPPGCRVDPDRWCEEAKPEPGTGYKRQWLTVHAYREGWRLSIQPELGWMEVSLTPARLARPGAIHNFPLMPLAEKDLWQVERAMVSLLRPPKDFHRLSWGALGVKNCAYTCDVPVQDPAGTMTALKSLSRAGRATHWDTTSQWVTGARRVQFYEKAAQSKAKLSKGEFAELSRRHPELGSVIRMEVTLAVTELRRLFKLPTGRLPTLKLINRSDVAQFVLWEELVKRLKLPKLLRTQATPGDDRVIALFDALVAASSAGDKRLTFDRVCKLCLVYFFTQTYKGQELCERLGSLSPGYVAKLRAELRELGFPPKVTIDPHYRVCLRQLHRGLLLAIGGVKKLQLSDEQRHAMSVVAPWAADSLVPGPGMEVDDGTFDVDESLLDLLVMNDLEDHPADG